MLEFGRIWVRIGPKGDIALKMGHGGLDGRTYIWMYVQMDEQMD